MKVIYESDKEMYGVEIEHPENLIWINTKDITEAKEQFVNSMTMLFNDAVCEALKIN